MNPKYIYKQFGGGWSEPFTDIYKIIGKRFTLNNEKYYSAKLIVTTSKMGWNIGQQFTVSCRSMNCVTMLYETMEELIAEHIVEFL